MVKVKSNRMRQTQPSIQNKNIQHFISVRGSHILINIVSVSLFHFSVSGGLLRLSQLPSLSLLSQPPVGLSLRAELKLLLRGKCSLIAEYRWRIFNDQNHDTYRV